MRRFLYLLLGASAMLLVALTMAFVTMRFALHGREVSVPNLAGMSNSEAESMADKLGLNLVVENRFYSTGVGPNHVLSQAPLPGNRVRRGWQVRVTESLGGQRVRVPDVVGQPERLAGLALRRLAVETGGVAHLPVTGPAGIVLAQSPPANAAGADGARVSLLLSAEPDAASSYGFVMPPLVGLPLGTATQRLATAGLRLTVLTPVSASPSPESADGSVVGDTTAQPEPIPVTSGSIIVTQNPQPGKRVQRGESIRVTLSH